MHWSEIWYGKGAAPTLARLALTPASLLYALGWTAYESMYKLGIKKPKEPHKPVVCVGNLQVGGTGKTPATMYVATALGAIGRKVAISCSGYGSPRAEGATLAPAGELDPLEWGDEPALIRSQKVNTPLIVGRNRVRAAEICRSELPDHVLLLDDGFQHLPLKKHVSIILDPDRGNKLCLPAGPYREPRSGLQRASAVLPRDFFVQWTFEMEASSDMVKGKVNVVCALANPQSFLASLTGSGYELVRSLLLPDHDDLQDPALLQGLDRSIPLVCTAKDYVKLRRRKDLGDFTLYIADKGLFIEPEEDFNEWLSAQLQ